MKKMHKHRSPTNVPSRDPLRAGTYPTYRLHVTLVKPALITLYLDLSLP